jgi:ectoine hydroxylase-related dioxygenase (phytanoyl-CoA dioxygenase family)
MSFVTGSHRDSDVFVSTASILAGSEVHGRGTVPVDVVSTDVIAFHPRVLHSTSATASDKPRRSFTLRFAGDDVRWRPRRSVYHDWMRDCGLQKGDRLEHPWFPVVGLN